MAVPLLVELQDTIREGRALLKDMGAERKEIERLLKAVPTLVDEQVQGRIEENMKALGDEMKGAMDLAVDRINGTFDRLTEGLKAMDVQLQRSGKGALEELFRLAADEVGAHRSKTEVKQIISKSQVMSRVKEGKVRCQCGQMHR